MVRVRQHRIFRMALRGQLETVDAEVDADGIPYRYHWGAYDGM